MHSQVHRAGRVVARLVVLTLVRVVTVVMAVVMVAMVVAVMMMVVLLLLVFRVGLGQRLLMVLLEGGVHKST